MNKIGGLDDNENYELVLRSKRKVEWIVIHVYRGIRRITHKHIYKLSESKL